MPYQPAACLHEILDAALQQYSGQVAYTCMGQSLTYAELDRLSMDMAYWFVHGLGLRPGDRLAIQLPNLLQYPLVSIAAIRAGVTIVNVNPLYTARELRHQLIDSGAVAIVLLSNLGQPLLDIIGQTAITHVVTTQVGDLHGPVKGPFLNFCARIRRGQPSMRKLSCTSLRKALVQGARLRKQTGAGPMPAVDPDSLAVLQYTGGTTGVSKGAMLSHANLTANLRQLQERFAQYLQTPGEKVIAPLPLYHIYAFMVSQLFCLSQGLHTVLVPNPRQLDSFVKLLCRHRFSGFTGITTLYRALLNHRDIDKVDFSGLRLCSTGGMSLDPEVARRWYELTGNPIIEGYGLTEASPGISCCSPANWDQGTVGMPMPDTELAIRNESGEDLPVGHTGEIWVKGPQVMLGYWQQPEETAAVMDGEGWLRTGDAGKLQDDGQLVVIDRIKDVINVSGFNVYPNEIEEHAVRMPGVLEAVAFGKPDGRGGEKVVLVVVPENGTLQCESVMSWCRQGLTSYKVPRVIEFRSSLPKSGVGKVLRRALREEANG